MPNAEAGESKEILGSLPRRRPAIESPRRASARAAAERAASERAAEAPSEAPHSQLGELERLAEAGVRLAGGTAVAGLRLAGRAAGGLGRVVGRH